MISTSPLQYAIFSLAKDIIVTFNYEIKHHHVKTCLRSQVEGLRISGRVRNIPFDFGGFFAISQNILILVSHVLQKLMKKLKFSPFGKIEKCQIWVKYEK